MEHCYDKKGTPLLYVTQHGHSEIVSLTRSPQGALPRDVRNAPAPSVSLSCFSISQGICQQAFDQIILTFYPWHIITNVAVTKAPYPFSSRPDENRCLAERLHARSGRSGAEQSEPSALPNGKRSHVRVTGHAEHCHS